MSPRDPFAAALRHRKWVWNLRRMGSRRHRNHSASAEIRFSPSLDTWHLTELFLERYIYIYIETKKFKSIWRFLEKSREIHRLPRLARRPKWLLRIIDHAVDTETSYAVTASTAYSNLPYQNLSKYLNSLHGVYKCLQLYYCTFRHVHISICLG